MVKVGSCGLGGVSGGSMELPVMEKGSRIIQLDSIMFKVYASNITSLFHSHSCMCATLGLRVGTICSVGGVRAVSGWLSEVEMLEVGRATGGDNPQQWVTPRSFRGQYLSLSCWARSLSPTGGLLRASVRLYQVGGGLVHFSQTVNISRRRLLIW